MRQSGSPHHALLQEAVEEDALLQAVASVHDDVRLRWTESDQAGGQEVVLALWKMEDGRGGGK